MNRHTPLGVFLALLAAAGLLLAGPAAAASAQPGGEPGRLAVVLDGEHLDLVLEVPSVNLFGFIGTPLDEQQRATARHAAALLHDAGTMFWPSPGAGCRIVETKLSGSVPEAVGEAGVRRPGEMIGDLRERDVPLGGQALPPPDPLPSFDGDPAVALDEVRAAYRYECSRPDALQELAVQVFASFPAIQTLLVTFNDGEATGQLSAAAPVLELPRRDPLNP